MPIFCPSVKGENGVSARAASKIGIGITGTSPSGSKTVREATTPSPNALATARRDRPADRNMAAATMFSTNPFQGISQGHCDFLQELGGGRLVPTGPGKVSGDGRPQHSDGVRMGPAGRAQETTPVFCIESQKTRGWDSLDTCPQVRQKGNSGRVAYLQSSTSSPGTRPNSRRLEVARERPWARQEAASQRS